MGKGTGIDPLVRICIIMYATDVALENGMEVGGKRWRMSMRGMSISTHVDHVTVLSEDAGEEELETVAVDEPDTLLGLASVHLSQLGRATGNATVVKLCCLLG